MTDILTDYQRGFNQGYSTIKILLLNIVINSYTDELTDASPEEKVRLTEQINKLNADKTMYILKHYKEK